MFPIGNPDDIEVGTLRTGFTIVTSFGPGEFAVRRIAMRSGLYEVTSY